MLIVFNLDWKACDIDRKVTQASRSMNSLVEAMGVGLYVRYDLTSIGAGEQVYWKSAPPECRSRLGKNLDFLREQHAELRRDLDQDAGFRQYKSTAEMLTALRGNRHTLAVVFKGEEAECDDVLRRARLREFFESRVYGTDSLGDRQASLSDLYAQAVSRNKVSLNDVKVRRNDDNAVFAVDDTLEGAMAGKDGKIRVAAYVSLENCPDDQVRDRSAEMVEAGAAYVVSTPMDILDLPRRVSCERSIFGQKDLPGLPAGLPVLNFGNNTPAP